MGGNYKNILKFIFFKKAKCFLRICFVVVCELSSLLGVYVCLCLCMYVFLCVCMLVEVRSQPHVSSLVSTLLFKAGSLSVLELTA